MMITTGWEKYASLEGEAALKKALAEVIRERDEARAMARDCLNGCCGDTRLRELALKYPWLKGGDPNGPND